MKTYIVIPSRYDSKRLPGKPLALIAGKSLLERVWVIAKAVKNVDEVIIATDDDRIVKHAESFGAKAVMTSPDCENGTARVYDALKDIASEEDLAINLQGDAVLTPPWIIQALVDKMQKEKVAIATPAVKLSIQQAESLRSEKAKGSSSGTLVVFNYKQEALYFSKNFIPYIRKPEEFAEDLPVYRHIGLYAYRMEALKKYLSLPKGNLERAEKLEQLRALENGISIQVVIVDYKGRSHVSIDNPEDILEAERIIAIEGELGV